MANVLTTARRRFLRQSLGSLLAVCLLATLSPAAPPVAEGDAGTSATPSPADAAAQQKLNDGFAALLTGATMRGSFTIDREAAEGEPARPPREEEYAISSATHLGGELWLITSRIRYGDVDATVPVPVVVKWAGSTPVITLDEITLPGMGTFSARVLFHSNRYAGTWQHDQVGGLMFGRVEAKAE